MSKVFHESLKSLPLCSEYITDTGTVVSSLCCIPAKQKEKIQVLKHQDDRLISLILKNPAILVIVLNV